MKPASCRRDSTAGSAGAVAGDSAAAPGGWPDPSDAPNMALARSTTSWRSKRSASSVSVSRAWARSSTSESSSRASRSVSHHTPTRLASACDSDCITLSTHSCSTHRVPAELAPVQPLAELGVQGRGLVLEGVELALKVVVALLRPAEVGLQVVELALQRLFEGVVEKGGAEHQPDAEGEKDGGERDDVEAEVDHQPENSDCQKARNNSRTGSDNIRATDSVKTAARIIHSRSVVRTEVR